MICFKNKASLRVKFFLGIGLFFSFTSFAMAQTAPERLEHLAEAPPLSDLDPSLPFKSSQVGGAPLSHSLAEYFKISEVLRTEIERFCGNISARAGDTRSTLQIEKMLQLKTDIEEKIKTLEKKRQEYELWLKKRNEFLEKTKDSLVDIISKMKPSVAADQLALVDDLTAASIILKLNPRTSSLIMNELPPQKTASITRVLVSAQKIPPQQSAKPQQVNNQTNGNG